MAIQNLSDLLRIQQEAGFYGAGGGKPPEGTQLGEALGNVGQGLGAVNTGIQQGQKTLEGQLMLKKLSQQIAPVGQYLDKNSPFGISPQTPTEVVPALAGLQYRNAMMQNLMGGVYVNPDDQTDISPTPDETHTIRTKSQYALMNESRQQIAQMQNEIAQAKLEAEKARNTNQADYWKNMVDVKQQLADLYKQRMEQTAQTAAQATTQRASTAAQEHTPWYRRFLGLESANPQSYLNSAGQNQSNNPDLLNSLIQKHSQ